MERDGKIAILGNWLRKRLPVLGGALLFCALFCLLIGLQYGDAAVGLYGTALCLFLLSAAAVPDYLRYLSHSRRLYQTWCNLESGLESLPEPADAAERKYQLLLEELFRSRAAILSDNARSVSEMTDYYTLWAHQIKTPIAALRLLLQEEDLNSGRYAMEQELSRIEQYAEMALCYLRLDGMAEDLLIQEYDLYELVRQAVRKNSVGFICRKLSLQLEEFTCRIRTDEKWLLFALEQILSNCVKYTRERGSVSILLRRESVPEASAVLLIRDTGIGIGPEDLPRIFDKGFTGYNGRLDKKSTGIGLYLTKQILTRMSLEIGADSQVGTGTQFCIRIPAGLLADPR